MRIIPLLIIQWATVLLAQEQSPKLYVFLPSNIRPHSLHQTLVKACPNLDISVFGRYREFQSQIVNLPPDGFLSLQPVAQNHTDYKETLSGTLKGMRREEYVFLSVNQSVDLNNLDKMTLGVIDLIGRGPMADLLSEKLKIRNPKIKTVTKFEDLLSLLQFQDVDAIFIPESKIEYYDKRTRLILKTTRLPNVTIGRPVLAVNNKNPKAKRALTDAILSLNQDLNSKLGVDRWVQP